MSDDIEVEVERIDNGWDSVTVRLYLTKDKETYDYWLYIRHGRLCFNYWSEARGIGKGLQDRAIPIKNTPRWAKKKLREMFPVLRLALCEEVYE